MIPPGKIYISATAFVSGTKKLETASIGVLTTASGITFDKALFSDGQLAVNDAYIDSFSSDNTALAGAVVNSLPPSWTEHAGWSFQYAPYLTLVGQYFAERRSEGWRWVQFGHLMVPLVWLT